MLFYLSFFKLTLNISRLNIRIAKQNIRWSNYFHKIGFFVIFLPKHKVFLFPHNMYWPTNWPFIRLPAISCIQVLKSASVFYLMCLCFKFQTTWNRISGIMVCVIVGLSPDHVKPDYKRSICCFTAKHAALRMVGSESG